VNLLLFHLSQVVKLLAQLQILALKLFLQAFNLIFEGIDCDLLLLLDGSYHIVLEVVNALAERCEIVFNGLRVHRKQIEHFVDLFSQSVSYCFRNICVKGAKHGSDIQLGVRVAQLLLNFDNRVKDGSYLFLLSLRVTQNEDIIF
jgi:hypothetical protein